MRKLSASPLRLRHAENARGPHRVFVLPHVRRPGGIRGRDEHPGQRKPPQKRISRFARWTDQDPAVLRQPVVVAGQIRLRFGEGEVIVVGIGQIVRARAIRHPARQVKRVLRQALPARMLADGLVDRLALILGHGENVVRADEAGEAEASGAQKSAASGQWHFRTVGSFVVFVFSSHELPPSDQSKAIHYTIVPTIR